MTTGIDRLRDLLEAPGEVVPGTSVRGASQLSLWEDLLTLVVDLEDHFRVALKEEDAAVVRTVAGLAALVLRRREEAAAC